ncbi:DUF4232 domain-containing protein [Saccharopolyspora phatthalungensis]|uniref:DUF4232 domain-containing protein n=1 Tax=Saccharopolyspora phatthalungensis TaxID=664693 RepID=A0A840Q1C2_9PSEU|nr:DUF4232 domain-containing protein [Saccharopolyspora phatthalungensis]MBB5153760.1 hypothetical protein [Saccharopolyspora phatthalungensis]
MTPHRLRWLGLRTAQASGALLIAGLMTGCGTSGGPNGQVITAPNVPPAPPAIDSGTQTLTSPPQTDNTGSAESQALPDPVATRPQSSKVTRCHTSMLSGSLRESEAGAGQRYAELVLRNSSHQTCTLYGYGGMQLVDQSGRPLPTSIERTPNPGPSLITLGPGETASATLHWTVVSHDGEPTNGPCQPTPARARVIPPDETDPITVTWNSGPVCGFGSISGSAYHR